MRTNIKVKNKTPPSQIKKMKSGIASKAKIILFKSVFMGRNLIQEFIILHNSLKVKNK